MNVPMSILYIEDNPSNVIVVERIVESMGGTLIVAYNATDGLEIAFKTPPDLVLMDISLPDMDGLTATGLLRANPLTASLPIIALTASAMVGDRERCIAAGCNEYVAKPLQVKTLVTVINQFIRQKNL